VNHLTKQTQWDRPSALGPAPHMVQPQQLQQPQHPQQQQQQHLDAQRLQMQRQMQMQMQMQMQTQMQMQPGQAQMMHGGGVLLMAPPGYNPRAVSPAPQYGRPQ
jgi:hypothetical protein